MKTADRSGFWFGALLVVSFGIVAVLFFGNAVTSSSFWISIASITPGLFAVTLMRPSLSQLPALPRFVAWFCLGVTAAVALALISGREFALLDFAIFGAFLAAFDLLAERFGPKEDAE